jgi:hypothetical protein
VRDGKSDHSLPEPNWWFLVQTPSYASESDRAKVMTQQGGNASPAINKIFIGTTINDICVAANSPALMRVDSESASNKIDESDSQLEKQNEQRI